MGTAFTGDVGIALGGGARMSKIVTSGDRVVGSCLRLRRKQCAVSERRLFLQFAHHDGYPDGMTVDAEDCVWIAFWDGWCIRRFSPQGELLVKIPMPVQRPTSVAFGGADFTEIFVSSASRDLSAQEMIGQPHAGGLFRFSPGVKGIAELPFAG